MKQIYAFYMENSIDYQGSPKTPAITTCAQQQTGAKWIEGATDRDRGEKNGLLQVHLYLAFTNAIKKILL